MSSVFAVVFSQRLLLHIFCLEDVEVTVCILRNPVSLVALGDAVFGGDEKIKEPHAEMRFHKFFSGKLSDLSDVYPVPSDGVRHTSVYHYHLFHRRETIA